MLGVGRSSLKLMYVGTNRKSERRRLALNKNKYSPVIRCPMRQWPLGLYRRNTAAVSHYRVDIYS